jgi:hypothetical protein
MAKFGWAYINCSDAGSDGSGSAGPPYSLQFVTESGGETTGSALFSYYTASAESYSPSTLVLSGNLIVTGSISASVYYIKDISIIDATGSTYFGDTNNDVHIRTGSFVVTDAGAGPLSDYVLSASIATSQTFVKGLVGNHTSVTSTPYTVLTSDHIIGVAVATATVITVPLASTIAAGSMFTIKDEIAARTGASNNITITSSSPDQNLFDNETTYVLTGTMPAISLYSNGTNWFVF